MNANKAPIFIVGCGHSGTSIMLAILGAHSGILAVPYESGFAYKWQKRPEDAEHFISVWNTAAAYCGKRRWVEKTPRHIFRMREILDRFPEGKILLMIRDGRDVACSIQDRFGSLKRGINRWVEENREGEKHWNHPNVLRVRYESLVEAPEGTLEKVAGFLGEPFEPAMLGYHRLPRFYYHNSLERPPDGRGANHEAYRNWQINQPLFDGRGKWRRMTEEEKRLVKEKAGQMLVDYGYASDLHW
jgi:hypothetical protein